MSPETPPHQLVDLLGDADPGVRLRAALELGEAAYTPAAGPLVERFGHERDFQIREILTWAVLRVRDAALPLVHAALTSPHWLARLQAVHTVSKIGSPDDGPRLLALLDDPVDAVAARAYGAAAQTRNPVTIPALTAQLARGNSEHQNSLTVALGAFGPDAVPALTAALSHPEPEVRRHAADTLSHMGSPDADDATPALAVVVADPVEAVRLAALNALGQLVVREAWTVVDAATGSGEARLRHLAERLTERRPGERALRMAELRRRAKEAPGSLTAPPAPGSPTAPPAPGSLTAPAAPPALTWAGPWPAPDLDLVTLEGGARADELAPALARQVEFCRPRWLSREDVPPELLARAHTDAVAAARAAGTAEELVERVARGRVEQLIHESVMLEQVSVATPGRIVKDLLFGTGVHVAGFRGQER